MAYKHVDESLDRRLLDLFSCDLPFGGKVMVFGVDFREILPVIKRTSRGDVVSVCLNRSIIWRYVKARLLINNMSLRKLSSQDSLEISEFSISLLRLREGTEPEDENQKVYIDPNFVHPWNDISGLIYFDYGDIVNNYRDPKFICQRIIMPLKNETTDVLNDHVMQLIPGAA